MRPEWPITKAKRGERGEGRVESGGEAQTKGFVRDKPERLERANETKAMGRAKNQIRDVHCSGIVQVELQVCLRPPSRLTAQTTLGPHGGFP